MPEPRVLDGNHAVLTNGPLWVISVTVFPSFGRMADSQRLETVLVEGSRRESAK